MTRAQRRASRRLRSVLTVASVALVATGATFYFSGRHSSALADAPSTTTTSTPKEAREDGWTVVAEGRRGVYSDRKTVVVDGISFTVARFRQRNVRFTWHAGSEDPPGFAASHPGYGNAINFAGSEGTQGVLGVLNGAFKLDARAGGLRVADQVVAPFVLDYATAAIDADGRLTIFQGPAYAQPPGFTGVVFRQNLPYLVNQGALTDVVKQREPGFWGGTIKGGVAQARTGLGLDMNGNVLYVATMGKCLPIQLARALVLAGARKAMELDINPYWPIMGMASTPLKSAQGGFAFALPGAEHAPRVFITGWTRDFFVVTARP